MANQIHVVPHFHWDREWYFTAEESKILLVNDMEEVLCMLEENASYPYFILDGQTAVLEDYLSVKPENRERLRALIQKGKLIIGPWYTQTDEMVVGGESIVRNLLYGKKDCEEFGPRMMIGYLPDSFGQSASLPQILNGFGINRCIFWRGTSERMGTDKTEFFWEGGDQESKVTVQLLPLGYAIGKYLPLEEKALRGRMDKYLPVLDRGATTDHILLPNGHDQMPIQKNIFEVMKQIERCYPGRTTRLSRYEDVFDIIEQQSELDTLHGEFLDGKYMRVHRSIYSSRADLKAANTRIENKITNLLEPLASIAYSLGFEYHHGLIEAIWKELMKNHAHDSIGCCCSDKVHRAIADRFFLAEERTDQLIEFYKRKITDAMSCQETLDKLTVFNTLGYERSGIVTGEIITKMKQFRLVDDTGAVLPFQIVKQEVVDAGLIDRQIVHYGDYDPFVRYTVVFEDQIPSMGYKTYLIQECKEAQPVVQEEECKPVLENSYYRIQIEQNGSLTIEDKVTGVCYEQVLMVEDGSDDGDGYDYSPLEQDWILRSENVCADTKVRRNAYMEMADIAFTMQIPKDLESRKKHIADGQMDICFHIVMKKNSPTVEISMEVENHAKDHRVRVLIPNRKGSSYSISDTQFGMIRRPAVDPAMEVWEQERWSERPDSIYPFLSFIRQDNQEGIAVLTNSVREYELIGEEYQTIALTIFRSVGVLGKENLYRRPGRPSGIKMETPDSQLLKHMIYEFAMTTDCIHAAQRAKEYTTPFVTYNKMPYNAMKLNDSGCRIPYRYSLLRVADPSVLLSTLKKEEQGKGLLLRCYNPSDREVSSILETNYEYMGETMLDESYLQEDGRDREFTLKQNQIRTFLLK